MKTLAIAAGALAAGVVASPATPVGPAKRASSITPITVKGNAFFAGDTRFYVRGVDYQPGGSSNIADPLADEEQCKRDIEKFKDLGLNTVRVYSVDNSKSHDACMNALADAGIYVALDVNTPNYSLRRDSPAKSYNKVYLQAIFATIDAFKDYPNTLLFFSGNEVINDDKTSSAAPYVKAVTRDMKSYINARKYRAIPVGYSAADVAENRLEMAQYMNCGPDAARSDFFAFNDYSWCDPDTFEETDWGMKVKNFSDYSIPLFLSEYGCNKNKRQFNQVAALYSDKMDAVYSGGLVYQYLEESDNPKYGLVEIDGSSIKELDDYTAFKSALAKAPAPSGDGGYKQSGSASKCPTKSSHWDVDIADDELPAFPSGADEYFTNGAGEGKGLTGGSQEAGSTQVSLAPAASGAVTTGSTASGASGSKGAAPGLHPPDFQTAPLVCGLVVMASAILGGALVL